jgi:hypothetical protein
VAINCTGFVRDFGFLPPSVGQGPFPRTLYKQVFYPEVGNWVTPLLAGVLSLPCGGWGLDPCQAGLLRGDDDYAARPY